MNKATGNCDHCVWVEGGAVFIANDDDGHYKTEYNSANEVDELISKLKKASSEAFNINHENCTITVERLAGEAYQIIGYLAGEAGLFDSIEAQKALDYFDAIQRGETPKDTILPFCINTQKTEITND